LQKADGPLRQLIVKKEQLFGAEHPKTLSTKVTYAIACFAQHRVQEGTEILRMVYSIRIRVLGPEHPQTRSVAELVAFIGEQTEDISNIEPVDSASLAG
jgi:MarR-like DNA-binding transcriptional regulator SgrR of sgrS sRNA